MQRNNGADRPSSPPVRRADLGEWLLILWFLGVNLAFFQQHLSLIRLVLQRLGRALLR